MSTRARIGIVNADKTITSIYSHYDGYVSHHGPILLEHYNTAAKLRKLLKLGDLSSLAAELGKKHDFDTSHTLHEGWCCAYGRDRGESDVSAREDKDLNAFKTDLEEYTYLFVDGKWAVMGHEYKDFVDLYVETITERLTS